VVARQRALDIAASNAAAPTPAARAWPWTPRGRRSSCGGRNGGVFARRVIGLAPSQYPAAVSLPDLGPADLPEVDVEEDGSFGWVAFRQRDPNGPRALARRIRGPRLRPAVRARHRARAPVRRAWRSTAAAPAPPS
jgi:hypothetical protein